MTNELKIISILGVLGIGMVLGLKFLFPFVAPFLLGITFACLVEPTVRNLERRFKVKRSVAAAIVVIWFLMGVLAVTGLALFSSFREAQRLLPKVPVLIHHFSELGTTITFQLARLIHFDVRNFSFHTGPLAQIFQSLIRWVLQLLPQFPEIIITIALGGVTAYFFSRDLQPIRKVLFRCLPRGWWDTAIQIKDEVITKMGQFLRAEFILSMITMFLTVLFFAILKIPGAFAYGLFAGILILSRLLAPG